MIASGERERDYPWRACNFENTLKTQIVHNENLENVLKSQIIYNEPHLQSILETCGSVCASARHNNIII